MFSSLKKKISFDNPLRLFWHRLKGMTAALRYGFPARNLVVIGITGTDGKTTTTHMVEHILRTNGKKVAMISTVEFSINGHKKPNLSKKTTLSPFQTQKFLRTCVKKKIDYVVLEASSHSLHQSRLWGIQFSIAALTNLTHEHLDYHGTMEKYAAAKKLLFQNVSVNCLRVQSQRLQSIPHVKAMVLNANDAYYKNFDECTCPIKVPYGIGVGELQAADLTYTKSGSTFAICYRDEVVGIQLSIAGDFNIENALTASGVALACKLSLHDIKKGLETFEGVSGRMERIKSPAGFEAVVDFALTPKALERLYKNLKQTTHGRVIGIIGSCGDRDREKRPMLGEIVANYTDYTIVTDEEPYSEDPMAIMQAVLEGAQRIKRLGKNLELIEDRYLAIQRAIRMAQKDDLVVITGMGSFQSRNLNEGEVPWDEREVVREIINKYS